MSILSANAFPPFDSHGIRNLQEGVDYIFNEAYRCKLEEPRSIEVSYERRRVQDWDIDD